MSSSFLAAPFLSARESLLLTGAETVYAQLMDKKPENKPEPGNAPSETNQFLKVHQQALERRRQLNQQTTARRAKEANEMETSREEEDTTP